MGAVAVMAKKKPGPRPNPLGSRDQLIAFKCSAEYKRWAEEGADFCRTDVSKLLDVSLVEYLKARGFTKEPPKR